MCRPPTHFANKIKKHILAAASLRLGLRSVENRPGFHRPSGARRFAGRRSEHIQACLLRRRCGSRWLCVHRHPNVKILRAIDALLIDPDFRRRVKVSVLCVGYRNWLMSILRAKKVDLDVLSVGDSAGCDMDIKTLLLIRLVP